MKNKVFNLACAAFLLFSVGTFTSCSNDDDPVKEEKPGGGGNNTDDGDDDNVLDLNGTYSESASADGTLTMTYNGASLTGKKVTFMADEDNTSAVIELAGETLDFTDMISGLLPWEVETYSPVPGMKTLMLNEVELTTDEDGNVSFEGEEIQPTFTLGYKGTVAEDESGNKVMTIELTHQLTADKLVGVWDLAPVKTYGSGDHNGDRAPLWWQIDSDVEINLGKVSIVTLKGNLDGLLNTICGLGALVFPEVNGVKGLEQMIAGVLKGVTAYEDGSMTATYAWNDDWKNPQWSSEMPANSLRYYYGESEGQLYLEVNPSLIVDLVSGLINPASRAGDPEVTKEIGRKLIEKLNPVLAAGVPITYTLDGDKLRVHIDEKLMLDIFQILGELLQDEYASGYIEDFLPSLGLGDMTSLVSNLLKQLPYVVRYHDGDAAAEVEEAGTGNLTGQCGYVRLGFDLVRGTAVN